MLILGLGIVVSQVLVAMILMIRGERASTPAALSSKSVIIDKVSPMVGGVRRFVRCSLRLYLLSFLGGVVGGSRFGSSEPLPHIVLI